MLVETHQSQVSRFCTKRTRLTHASSIFLPRIRPWGLEEQHAKDSRAAEREEAGNLWSLNPPQLLSLWIWEKRLFKWEKNKAVQLAGLQYPGLLHLQTDNLRQKQFWKKTVSVLTRADFFSCHCSLKIQYNCLHSI